MKVPNRAKVSDVVKNLKVDADEFHAAMRKLIATPPMHKPAKKQAVRRKTSR